MVTILQDEGNFVAFKLSGKLTDEDFKTFVPVIEAAAGKGKLHLLVEMQDFEGWDSQALWDDIKLDAQLDRKIERVAIVGDTRWEEWMAKICRPFTSATIEYFGADDMKDAEVWVQDGL